jgi:hypothetical protein
MFTGDHLAYSASKKALEGFKLVPCVSVGVCVWERERNRKNLLVREERENEILSGCF